MFKIKFLLTPLAILFISFLLPFLTNKFEIHYFSFFDYIIFLSLFFFSTLYFIQTNYLDIKKNKFNYLLNIFFYSILFIFCIYFGAFQEYFSKQNGFYDRSLAFFSVKHLFILLLLILLNFMSIKSALIDRFIVFIVIFIIAYVFSMYAIDIDSRYMANNLNYGVVVMPIINLFYGSYLPVESQSQYGYYPYFIVPFLKIMGLSITSINMIFASISAVSFGAIFLCLFKILKSYFYASISFICVFFLLTFFGAVWPGELYFQYNPIRIFIPVFSLVIVYFYLNQKISALTSLSLISILCLWNIDSGIPCLLSFLILFFIESWSKREISFFLISIFRFLLILLFLGISVQTFFVYSTDQIVNFHQFFEPQLSFRKHEVFFNNSLTMYVLLSINGLLFFCSFLNYKTSKDKFFLIPIFISILTFGLMSYGSRHHSTLAFSIFLLPVGYSIFIYSYNKINSKTNFILLNLPLIFFSSIFFISISSNSSFFHTSNFVTKLLDIDIKEFEIPNHANNSSLWLSEQEMKNKKIKPIWINKLEQVAYLKNKYSLDSNSSIFVASERDHLIHLELETSSPLNNVNWHHIAYYNRWDDLFSSIKSRKFDYVITDDSYLYRFADWRGPESFNKFEKLLNENYDLIDSKEIGYQWFYPGWVASKTNLYIKK